MADVRSCPDEQSAQMPSRRCRAGKVDSGHRAPALRFFAIGALLAMQMRGSAASAVSGCNTTVAAGGYHTCLILVPTHPNLSFRGLDQDDFDRAQRVDSSEVVVAVCTARSRHQVDLGRSWFAGDWTTVSSSVCDSAHSRELESDTLLP